MNKKPSKWISSAFIKLDNFVVMSLRIAQEINTWTNEKPEASRQSWSSTTRSYIIDDGTNERFSNSIRPGRECPQLTPNARAALRVVFAEPLPQSSHNSFPLECLSAPNMSQARFAFIRESQHEHRRLQFVFKGNQNEHG